MNCNYNNSYLSVSIIFVVSYSLVGHFLLCGPPSGLLVVISPCLVNLVFFVHNLSCGASDFLLGMKFIITHTFLPWAAMM